jgi:hypothetical protein
VKTSIPAAITGISSLIESGTNNKKVQHLIQIYISGPFWLF